MFERFTDRARRAVVLARDETKELHHSYVGSEHLFLGLLREGGGIAAVALKESGITLERAHRVVEDISDSGRDVEGQNRYPFTPRAIKILELALRVALELGHNYISTEHILLALIGEGEGVGAMAIEKCGTTLNIVKEKTLVLLTNPRTQPPVDGIVMPPSDEVVFYEHYGRTRFTIPRGAEVTRTSVTIRLPGSKKKQRFTKDWEAKESPDEGESDDLFN